QVAAVIGAEVPGPLLQAVLGWPEAAVQESLTHLQATELLYETRLVPTPVYTFKHVLTQAAAAQALLPRARQALHEQIAQVLEARFPETLETQSELLAYHYTEAGLPAHAVPYWQRAGQQALQRSANLEAVQHLTTGLGLLATLPDTPARAQQELDLRIALGPALMATKGYAAPEVEQIYARARELCRQAGDTPQLFPTLRGLCWLYLTRGGLSPARELGEQMLRLAQHVQDPAFLLEAYRALGAILFWHGEFVASRTHLEQGIALYNPQQHRSHAFVYAHDPGVGCLSYMSRVLWFQGYPNQALQRSAESLRLAQELAHPQSQAYALHFAAALHQHRGEWRAAQARAEALMALAREQ